MTIPPSSGSMPATVPAAPSPPVDGTGELGWLLDDFLAQVPGTKGAFLVARDGLVRAAAGLTADEADFAAAVAAGLYSAGKGGGQITSPPAGQVQQLIVQFDTQYLILMNTPDQHPDAPEHGETAPQAGSGGPWMVGCVLGVLTRIDAQTGLVVEGMAMLIESLARHLVTATRTPDAHLPAPDSSGTATAAGAGLGDEGSTDEQ